MSLQYTTENNSWFFQWPAKPIDQVVFNDIKAAVQQSTDYSIQKSTKLSNALKEKYPDIKKDQLRSIRNVCLKDKIISNYPRMNAKIRALFKEYETGTGILELSKKYDFPPLNLLRGILLRKMSSKEVHGVFRGNLIDVLTQRDRKEFKLATQADAEAYINQIEVAEKAAHNEELFIKYFQSTGIRLKTQAELVAEQTAQYGQPICTPDILFLDPVYINSQLVTWIDFKDYVGTDAGFIYKSNREQIGKYVHRWGRGALCYSQGYIEGLEFTGAMVLDGGVLPIKYKSLYRGKNV